MILAVFPVTCRDQLIMKGHFHSASVVHKHKPKRLITLVIIGLILGSAALVYGQRFRGFFFQNEPPTTELVVARWKYTAWGKFGGTGGAPNYPSSDQHFAQVVSEASKYDVMYVAYLIGDLAIPECCDYQEALRFTTG